MAGKPRLSPATDGPFDQAKVFHAGDVAGAAGQDHAPATFAATTDRPLESDRYLGARNPNRCVVAGRDAAR